jgi:predicted protein tyrosine phosphatase
VVLFVLSSRCGCNVVTIRVLPRREFEAHVFVVPSAVIAINSPGARPHRVLGGGMVRETLRLEFSDSVPWEPGLRHFAQGEDLPPGFVVKHFDEEMARQAWDVARFAEAEGLELFVTCLGGISRSRGVALGLAQGMGMDPTAVLQGTRVDPNPWCVSVMLEAGRSA